MGRRQRLDRIVSAVVERGQVDVPSLAAELSVSAATIRRDLQALQEQRLVCRTHGGATIHPAAVAGAHGRIRLSPGIHPG